MGEGGGSIFTMTGLLAFTETMSFCKLDSRAKHFDEDIQQEDIEID